MSGESTAERELAALKRTLRPMKIAALILLLVIFGGGSVAVVMIQNETAAAKGERDEAVRQLEQSEKRRVELQDRIDELQRENEQLRQQ